MAASRCGWRRHRDASEGRKAGGAAAGWKAVGGKLRGGGGIVVPGAEKEGASGGWVLGDDVHGWEVREWYRKLSFV